jgi:hypothetical protein
MRLVAISVNYLRKRRGIESKNRNTSKGKRIFTCFQISQSRELLHSFQGRNMRIRLKVMLIIRHPYTGETKTGCSCWENNICSAYMSSQRGGLGPPGAFVSLRASSVKLSFHCNRSLRKDGKTWNSNKLI